MTGSMVNKQSVVGDFVHHREVTGSITSKQSAGGTDTNLLWQVIKTEQENGKSILW